jgi:hypothetical protein
LDTVQLQILLVFSLVLHRCCLAIRLHVRLLKRWTRIEGNDDKVIIVVQDTRQRHGVLQSPEHRHASPKEYARQEKEDAPSKTFKHEAVRTRPRPTVSSGPHSERSLESPHFGRHLNREPLPVRRVTKRSRSRSRETVVRMHLGLATVGLNLGYVRIGFPFCARDKKDKCQAYHLSTVWVTRATRVFNSCRSSVVDIRELWSPLSNFLLQHVWYLGREF